MADAVKDVAAATSKDIGKPEKPKLSDATKAGIKQDLAEAKAAKKEFDDRHKPVERTEESMRPFKGPQSEPRAEEQPPSGRMTPIEEQLGLARPPIGDIQDKLVDDEKEPNKSQEAAEKAS